MYFDIPLKVYFIYKCAELSITAQQMVGKLSVSGVQPKLSVKLNKNNRALEVIAEGKE
jgi:hypothetical protein